MAEINIQRKKKPVWPWIILLLVIMAAAAIWYFNSSGADISNPINSTGYRQVYAQPMPVPQTVCLTQSWS
jgi:hypothetical protein